MGGQINSKVIYTAIFGDYSGLVPQLPIDGFDFICFTDQSNLKAKPWKVVQVQPFDKTDLTRSNRRIKILPHLFVGNYETSIYIDANFLIIGDIAQLVQQYLKQNNMATFSHTETIPDARDCIYEEARAIEELQAKGLYYKEDLGVLHKHIQYLKSQNYPRNNGLIKGGCLLRNHHHPEVIKLMEDWWYMVQHYSKRDQMSFNFVAWKNKFSYATIPGDIRRGNPYIYWLGNHRKDWSKKLFKLKLKRSLGLIKFPSI